jgi:hypothetical protein
MRLETSVSVLYGINQIKICFYIYQPPAKAVDMTTWAELPCGRRGYYFDFTDALYELVDTQNVASVLLNI